MSIAYIFFRPSQKPEKNKDNASGEPDVDGLGVGDRGQGLLGLHALTIKERAIRGEKIFVQPEL